MMNTRSLALCTSLLLSISAMIAGCGGEEVSSGTSELMLKHQISEGMTLYGEHCAKCHGASGEGTAKAPPLVGPTALPLNPRAGQTVRTMQFHTAADVLHFIRTKMPGDAPGSLHEDQYEAILAFALHANAVNLHGTPVSEATAPGIVLH